MRFINQHFLNGTMWGPPVMFVGLQTLVTVVISTINHSEIADKSQLSYLGPLGGPTLYGLWMFMVDLTN